MPYTLVMGTIWFLLALIVGLVIGWLLRSITAGRQVERARARNVDQVELDRLRRRVRELEDGARAAPSEPAGQTPPPPADDPGAAGLAAAAVVLGHEVERDDLQLVEGIGPDVEDLCHAIGIRTWADLASTEVSLLRTMLDDAGPEYAAHDPTTWPQQAALIVGGRWTDFRELSRQVRGSRS